MQKESPESQNSIDIRKKIKKEPHTQEIKDGRISYSILQKKSKSGFSKNQRVFFLVHRKCIAYANRIQNTTKLPYEPEAKLPQFKCHLDLDKIEMPSIISGNTLLIKQKKGKQKLEWQFTCPSPDCAKNWLKLINGSVKAMQDEANNQPQNLLVPEDQQQSNPQEQPNNQLQPDNNNQPTTETVKNTDQQQVINHEVDNQEPANSESNAQLNQPENTGQIAQSIMGLDGSSVKKEIGQPTSTFFVGSMSVEDEQDQKVVQSKIQSIESITLRNEYEKRKKQEKQLKQSIRKEESSLIGNVLQLSTDAKLRIEKMNKEWGYEFAKGGNEFDIIYDFKVYCDLVSKKIIDELGLQPKKRYYQPIQQASNTLKYEINGVIFEVFLTELKEIFSFNGKGTVVSKQAIKLAQHQFKNLNYVLNLTQNKGKIRVPLCCFLEYKGFNVLAKVVTPESENYGNVDLFNKELKILEANSRINNSIFQEQDFAKIIALQGKAYDKLARAENINKRFDLFYIESLKFYLPHDFNRFDKSKPYERLREELIQDDESDETIFYGQDMCSIQNRLKLPQHYRDGKEQLKQFSKQIFRRIDQLIASLEDVDQYFCNSDEISSLMHAFGINMRYLGVVLEKTKAPWLKELLMSEICARCGKNFLNFDLQDCILNLSESSPEKVTAFQYKQVVNFLNNMFGKSQDSELFWKQINKQSQSYFQVSANKEQIHQGFLLQAVQEHCHFKLKANNYNIFTNSSPFSEHDIASFETKVKTYDLKFTELYISVSNLLKDQSEESYDQLKSLLNLNRNQNIPSHFTLSRIYPQLINFLAFWLPPAKARNVYYPQEIELGQVFASSLLYQIKLTEIRWALKDNLVEQGEGIKKWVIDHINKWVGGAHPILTELYELFANYYLTFKDQEKKAVNYSKNAIENQKKLIGSHHQKVADNYYLLATILKHYGRKTQAINEYTKASDIIKNQNQNSEALGRICLEMGQLYLAVDHRKEATELGKNAMQVLSESGNNASLICAFELICRCYELAGDWESYFNLVESNLVWRVGDFIEDVELTERIIKLIILPRLRVIADSSSKMAQKILGILHELPETTRAPNMAFNFLRGGIEEQVFPQKFLGILEDIESVMEEIQMNGMVARWKGFENLSNKSLLNKVGINMENRGFYFISNLEALNIFLGGSFLEGLLDEI